jgi:uncharacterized membrane protein
MSSGSTLRPGSVALASVGSVVRPITLTLAVLTMGLISGFFYAYACSVTLGLALLPDEQYVEEMQAINATVRNGGSLSAFSARSCSCFWRSPFTFRVCARAASCYWPLRPSSTEVAGSW